MQEDKREIRVFWKNPETGKEHEIILTEEESYVIARYIENYLNMKNDGVKVNSKSSIIKEES